MPGGWNLNVVPSTRHQASSTKHLDHMRFIHLYLVGYFVLLVGAALALWQAGVLGRIPGTWLLIAAVIAVGLGIVLAVSSVRPTSITPD